MTAILPGFVNINGTDIPFDLSTEVKVKENKKKHKIIATFVCKGLPGAEVILKEITQGKKVTYVRKEKHDGQLNQTLIDEAFTQCSKAIEKFKKEHSHSHHKHHSHHSH